MNIASIHVGMRVRHPNYGTGTVKAVDEQSATILFDDTVRRQVDEQSATILFDDTVRRQVSPESCGLMPAEAQASISGLDMPLTQFIEATVAAVADRMGLEDPRVVRQELAARWHGGKLVLHPADPTLSTKEIPLEVLFHKIVMMRNNFRTLEQKLNSSESLSTAEKFDWQGYITRCYGSMTTFNVLFRRKEDQFNSKGGEE